MKIKTSESVIDSLGRFSALHGMHKTRTHTCWCNMKARCLNSKHKSYPRYGGRGIKVCDAWMSFAGFLKDMGEAGLGMTIERINTDGDYEPGNCRWATRKEQQRNTSKNQVISANGQSKTVAEWAEITGISQSTLSYRARAGWSGEMIISTMPNSGNRIAAKLGDEVDVPEGLV